MSKVLVLFGSSTGNTEKQLMMMKDLETTTVISTPSYCLYMAEKAKELGISPVLITCDDDNCASAKVMEHNGLTLQDKVINTIDGRTFTTRRYTKTL